MRWLTLLTACVCACLSVTTAHDSPVIHTTQGKLRGRLLQTYDTKRDIFSFIGVRFAEPPTGEYRWKDPVPVKSWNGVRDAIEDHPLCPQPVPESIKTSEDCLFLNVYSKTLTRKQPVMIYFHEGGFLAGTGNSEFFGPEYWLERDIVLVTFNYRLGPLGFLSSGDSVIAGNYGLKDQLAVMKWVKQNIAKFGGDPDSVTLFGYSAGGASIQLHLLSELSRGLFHRVIVSSCSATTPAALNRDPVSLSRRFAKLLNCPTGSSQQMRDCLIRLPEKDITAITAQNRIWDTLQPPFSVFAPVVERHDGDNKFLADDPVEIIKSGHFTQVPMITGFTRDEFSWRAQFLLINETYVNRINNEFDEIAPWEFQYPREPQELSKRISDAFKELYFNNQPVSNQTEKGLGELYADSLIIFSVYQASKLFAEKSSAPIYFYEFNFEGRYSFRYALGTDKPYGVEHHDNMMYLFYLKKRFPMFNNSDPEAYMVRTLTSIYSEFAKTGIPTLPDAHKKWLPMTKMHLRYLDIDKNLSMRDGLPYQRRMEVWDSLLPIDKRYRQIIY